MEFLCDLEARESGEYQASFQSGSKLVGNQFKKKTAQIIYWEWQVQEEEGA